MDTFIVRKLSGKNSKTFILSSSKEDFNKRYAMNEEERNKKLFKIIGKRNFLLYIMTRIYE